MVEVYRIFSRDYENCLNFDDDMLYEMYIYESTGGTCSDKNGFFYGKKFMDVTVKMWKEDVHIGTLFLKELYEDSIFPHWWLDKIFNLHRE